MKILNLVYPEKSDIKYTIQKFPDGQQNIIINKSNGAIAKTLREDNSGKYLTPIDSVQIKSRLNNWLDLELITCAVSSLRELGVEEIHLYAPYIIGARSDRKFEEGGNNYLRDVLCPIINSLNFKSVTCIDNHSDVLEGCIKGFKKLTNSHLFDWSMDELYGRGLYKTKGYPFILVSPDAGASNKIYKLAEQIGYKGDIITCSKDRDENGKLTKTIVPIAVFPDKKDFIVIDDIGDGFGTFINIIKEIKSKYPYKDSKFYLIVTHSIQESGILKALQYYDAIYTTNSVNDFNINNLKQLNVF